MFEQIYKDFSEKMLPEIAKGLTITKDYFTDLFGRYVHYLIVSDAFYAVVTLVVCIVSFIVFFKAVKVGKETDWDDGAYIFMLIGGFIVGIFTFFLTLHQIGDLIKDIYIPEIRVYEEIKSFTNSPKD